MNDFLVFIICVCIVVGCAGGFLLGKREGHRINWNEFGTSILATANLKPEGYSFVSNNFFVGAEAGADIKMGFGNIIIGNHSGKTLSHGSENILIGDNTDVPNKNTSDFINVRNQFCANIRKRRIVKCPQHLSVQLCSFSSSGILHGPNTCTMDIKKSK